MLWPAMWTEDDVCYECGPDGDSDSEPDGTQATYEVARVEKGKNVAPGACGQAASPDVATVASVKATPRNASVQVVLYVRKLHMMRSAKCLLHHHH